ncbi:MAG: glycosidase [Planctomycetaceae bacterium]|nr:hypothetical protein [Planctomycetaceae bacterium]
MKDLFVRSEHNPILTVHDLPVDAEAVLNPGVTEQDGQVVLLLRVENANGFSSIHVARSLNGVTGWKIEKEPLLRYGQPEWRYEKWGCEDPRVTWLEDQQSWFITYTAYSPSGAAVGLARTKDFASVERVGLIFPPNNKDAMILPGKVGDRYAALHRPDAGGGIENIWIAYSRNLADWGEPHCVLEEGHGPAWDANRIGAGPPPLLTDQGWLMLYHGVKMYGGKYIYRAGAAMLDRDAPHKVLATSGKCIFKPTEIYETSGLMPNVVFPTGTLQRGDDLWMYYGSADTCVALATARIKDIVNSLQPR